MKSLAHHKGAASLNWLLCLVLAICCLVATDSMSKNTTSSEKQPIGSADTAQVLQLGCCPDSTGGEVIAGLVIPESNPDWMGRLADDLLITELTLPGTHESMARWCVGCAWPSYHWVKCQSMDATLDAQLDYGIRVLDIRCAHEEDRFCIHHGVHVQKAWLGEPLVGANHWQPDHVSVLGMCVQFLYDHPLETILMRIQQTQDPYECTRSFWETFEWYRDEDTSVIAAASGDSTVHHRDFIWQSDNYEVFPTLSEVRGKIVILQDFSSPLNTAFGLEWGSPLQVIQDDWEAYKCKTGNSWPALGFKYLSRIVPMLERAHFGSPDTLYTNFFSATSAAAADAVYIYDIAWGCTAFLFHVDGMNERASSHLYDVVYYHHKHWYFEPRRYGLLMTDYVDGGPGHAMDAKFVERMIEQNPYIPCGNPDWMSQVPDDRLISELSIPGTHQSMARHGDMGPRCQFVPLEEQFRAGIRVVEVECSHEDDRFSIVSQVPPNLVQDQRAWFGVTMDSTGSGYKGHGNVLKECIEFLMDSPSETILLHIKPSSRSGVQNTRMFWETLEWYITEDGGSYGPNGGYVRYGDYVWQSGDYNTMPTMGDVRGKIVILQEFYSPEPFGLDWSRFIIQDFPVVSAVDMLAKWDSVFIFLSVTEAGARDTMHVNFLSGGLTTIEPRGIANGFGGYPGIAARGFDHLQRLRGLGTIWRCGIVMMDFPGPGFIDVIISHNDLVLTSVDDPGNETLPALFTLSQNYPNPFNPVTTIEYSLSQRCHVTIEVFNLLGQKVRTLIDREESASSYTITWNGTDAGGKSVATGVYLYRFQAGDNIETKKMLLLK